MSSPIHGNTSRSPNNITTTTIPSTQRTIETIRDVASNIRETSSRMRDVVRAVHQSGAIDELATAVHEAMIATRDTKIEISETADSCMSSAIGWLNPSFH